MLRYVIVWVIVWVGLIGMHTTGCSGKTRLVLHVPSSSWAGSAIVFIYYFYGDFLWSSGPQDLAGVIKQKAYRKRVLSRDVRWSFGAGFEIAVALYAMIQPAVKGTYTYVKAQNNEPLRSETAYICNDTGEPACEHRAALPFDSRQDRAFHRAALPFSSGQDRPFHRATFSFSSGQDSLFAGQHYLSVVGRTAFSQGSIAFL